MKSLINTLLIAGTVMMIQAAPVTLNAMSTNEPTGKEIGPVLRQDKVGADLQTRADRRADKVYDRKVFATNNGLFEVVITDAEGNVKMQGAYANEELTQAEGEFTYFYPNGNIESKGNYSNGVKTGTWYRFHADGSPKAERNYTGMTWEDMAVKLGMASVAH